MHHSRQNLLPRASLTNIIGQMLWSSFLDQKSHWVFEWGPRGHLINLLCAPVSVREHISQKHCPISLKQILGTLYCQQNKAKDIDPFR